MVTKGTAIETAEVDARLRSKGIECGLARLAKNPSLAPGCFAPLLELLAQPWAAVTKGTLAEALFERSPNPSQKRKAMELVLGASRTAHPKI